MSKEERDMVLVKKGEDRGWFETDLNKPTGWVNGKWIGRHGEILDFPAPKE